MLKELNNRQLKVGDLVLDFRDFSNPYGIVIDSSKVYKSTGVTIANKVYKIENPTGYENIIFKDLSNQYIEIQLNSLNMNKDKRTGYKKGDILVNSKKKCYLYIGKMKAIKYSNSKPVFNKEGYGYVYIGDEYYYSKGDFSLVSCKPQYCINNTWAGRSTELMVLNNKSSSFDEVIGYVDIKEQEIQVNLLASNLYHSNNNDYLILEIYNRE